MPLIVLEGIDGSGKTTQIAALHQRLTATGLRVHSLREPGGTRLGEQVRELLLHPATRACPAAELFGYLQARAQLCHEVIQPALAQGDLVLLDRFYHSTLAYQCYGLGLDLAQVRAANALATDGLVPDLVLWLDLDPVQAVARRSAAHRADRIEARGLAYLERVHAGYRDLCDSDGMHAIDASQPVAQVTAAIGAAVDGVLARIRPAL